jgi:type IX secretion system PorP/SprF family membrane protein
MYNTKSKHTIRKQYSLGIKILFGLILSAFSVTTLYAQREAMYSQYMFNMLNINPAYAGNRAVSNVTLLYRHQWAGIKGAPRTASLSWDQRASESNIGYGIQIFNDRLGLENSSSIRGFYSYRIPMKNSALSMGINAGVFNYQVDYTIINTAQSSDPLLNRKINQLSPCVGLGAIYESEKFYVGFSIPDLLDTYYSESDEVVRMAPKLHYFLNAGVMIKASDALLLKPSVMIKAISGAPVQFDAGINAWINNTFGFGASYRIGDALIGMFEVQLNSNLRLGYGYDYSISEINKYNSGTHELMLRYEFNKSKDKSKVLSPRYF